MFEGRTKLAYVAVALAMFGIVILFSAAYPFEMAYDQYPKTNPTMPTVASIPLVLTTNASSIETFVIAPRLKPFGYWPTNTITYSVQGSSITSQTPLNISVTLRINPIYPVALKYFIDPEFVVVDNSVLWWHGLTENGTIGNINLNTTDPQLTFTLVKNDSNEVVYSTGETLQNPNGTGFTLPDTISLTEPGPLTGTLVMLIGSKADPKSSAWFQGYTLQVRNATAIPVQSLQDLLLEEQNHFLEKTNLQNNAQIQYANDETQHNNDVVTALTFVIIGFVVVDVGVSFVDIGVSLYGESEKTNENRKRDAERAQSKATDEEP